MGAIDYGTQTISQQYFDPADAYKFNKRYVDIRKRGIYRGGYLTKVSDVQVTLSALVAELGDADYQVRVSTAATVTVTVSPGTPYVVLRWTYVASVSNYMDVLAVALGSIQANDLIIGKCSYSGATLNGFDYADRSTPNTMDLFLKVEPMDPASMRVRVRAGRTSYGTQNLAVDDQQSPLFTAPITNPRIDVIYVDSDGIVKVLTGTEAASPSAPDYTNKVALAEITLIVAQTTIVESDIRDVRAFLTARHEPVDSFGSGDLLFTTNIGAKSGWTDKTATYANRYVRIGATALVTGGIATHTHTGPSHNHTVPLQNYGWAYAAGFDGYIGAAQYVTTWSGAGRITTPPTTSNAGTGVTGAADNNPLYVDVRVYQKN